MPTDTSTDEVEAVEPKLRAEDDGPLVARIYLPLPTSDLAALLSSIQNVFPGCSVKSFQPFRENGYLEVRDTKEPQLVGQ